MKKKRIKGNTWRAGVGGQDPQSVEWVWGGEPPPRVRELSVSGAATKKKKCNVSSSLFTCYNRAHLLPVV